MSDAATTEVEWFEPLPEGGEVEVHQEPKLLKMDRRLRAMEMRRRGHHWDEVAKECGYKNAKSAASSVAKLAKKTVVESVHDYRNMQIDRCHEFLVGLGEKARAGDERAIDTSLRVMDKLDKLVGTEQAHVQATVEHTHTLVIESPSEERYVEQLRALSPPEPKGKGGPAPKGVVPNPYLSDVIDVEGEEV